MAEERRVMNTLDPVDSLSKYREQSFSERSLSRKFWSAENFGPGPIFSLKILVPWTNFFEKSGPGVKILVRAFFLYQPGDNAKLRIA